MGAGTVLSGVQRSAACCAVHGGQQVGDLGPLGRCDVLAHMDDAVHDHLRVLLHQAKDAQRKQALGDRRDTLENVRSKVTHHQILTQYLYRRVAKELCN